MPTPPDVRTFQAARCKAAKPSWVFWRDRLTNPESGCSAVAHLQNIGARIQQHLDNLKRKI
jgi:hypothetical protein